MLAQRVGAVTIDFSDPRPDLSVVEVPEDCVGYVMGKQGTTLRGMEDEWGTLMFFAKARQMGPRRRAVKRRRPRAASLFCRL